MLAHRRAARTPSLPAVPRLPALERRRAGAIVRGDAVELPVDVGGRVTGKIGDDGRRVAGAARRIGAPLHRHARPKGSRRLGDRLDGDVAPARELARVEDRVRHHCGSRLSPDAEGEAAGATSPREAMVAGAGTAVEGPELGIRYTPSAGSTRRTAISRLRNQVWRVRGPLSTSNLTRRAALEAWMMVSPPT